MYEYAWDGYEYTFLSIKSFSYQQETGGIILNIYELIGNIESSSLEDHWDNLPYSFNQINREKLTDNSDKDIFDLFAKAYEITIIYISDKRDSDDKSEYRKHGDAGLIPFTDNDIRTFNSLDWTRLPHNLKAHVFDIIWLCNHDYNAAIIAADEYYESYHVWFDEVQWVQCVDYISRAIELSAKIGIINKKDAFLSEVYNDIVKLNGEDSSFLSISLIELIVKQNYSCDYNTLIPFTDKLITKNSGSMNTAHILEQAYYIKAKLYNKLRDTNSENNVYIQYADALMQEADKLITTPNGEEHSVDNRNWFMAENNIKTAIGIYQNHCASEKAVNAQKRLVEIQKTAIQHISMQEFKCDVSDYYNKFKSEFQNHNIIELIWDVIFSFGFQNKQKIREDVTQKVSISSMFSMHVLGSEGQTEFYLPSLNLDDENNILQHMYHKAREYENIQGQTVGVWFIQLFRKQNLQESDLDLIFENNPIIPKGQEKDVQRGVYYGLTGQMSDALDKLAPKMENIIRNLAEMCGDLTTYYDPNEKVQQKKVLSQVFVGEKLNESIEENILFTFDGLLQQKAGSNIRNKTGHGLNIEATCSTGDCIYFVIIVLKFCALYCESFWDEFERRKKINGSTTQTDDNQEPGHASS